MPKPTRPSKVKETVEKRDADKREPRCRTQPKRAIGSPNPQVDQTQSKKRCKQSASNGSDTCSVERNSCGKRITDIREAELHRFKGMPKRLGFCHGLRAGRNRTIYPNPEFGLPSTA